MKKLISLLAVILLGITIFPIQVFADDPPIANFQISSDFSATQNPDSGWSYACASPENDDYVLFDHFYTFAGSDWWTKDFDNNWDYGRMGKWQCAPANNMDVAYIFTLPRDGVFTLETANGIKLGEYGNGISVAVFHKDVKIWPESNIWLGVSPGQTIDFPAMSISGKAGEKLYFRINANGNATNDNTEWDAKISYTSDVYNPDLDFSLLPDSVLSNCFGGAQGGGGWSYVYSSTGTNTYAAFNHYYEFGGANWWSQDSNNNWDFGRIGQWQIAPSQTMDVAYAYTLFRDGTIEISADENSVALNNYGDGARVALYKNNTRIWPENSEWQQLDPGQKVTFPTMTISAHKGEVLYFRVNSGAEANAADDNVTWNPHVAYKSFDYDKDIDPDSSVLPSSSSAMPNLPNSGTSAENPPWSYGCAEQNTNTYLPYDEVNSIYWTKSLDQYNKCGYISFAWNSLTPGWMYDTAFTYTMPKDGNIALLGGGETISFHPDKFGALEANIAIYKNNVRIWPLDKGWEKIEAKTASSDSVREYTFATFSISGKAGDKIHFRVNAGDNWSDNDSLRWSPSVVYTDLNYEEQKDPEKNTVFEYSKQFSDEQWQKGWGYLYAGIEDELALPQRGQYDGAWGAGSGNYTTGILAQNFLLPGSDNDVIVAFKAPVSGNISILFSGGKISLADSSSLADAGDGAAVGVFKNSGGEVSNIWPQSGMQQLANGEEVSMQEITLNIRKNEYIWFRANRGAQQNWHDTITMLPIITYNTKDISDPGVEDESSERQEKAAGADHGKLPDDIAGTPQPTSAKDLLTLLKAGTASGVYELSEDLVLDSSISGLEIDGSGVKIVFTVSGKMRLSGKNITLKNFTLNNDSEIVISGTNNVLLNSKVGTVKDETTDGAWAENCNITSAEITSSGSSFLYNDINGNIVCQDGGSIIQNILIAKNKLLGNISIENSNNSVILGNVFIAEQAKAIDAKKANNLTVFNNTFAGSATPIYLLQSSVVLITDNNYLNSTAENSAIVAKDSESNRVYGGNISGGGSGGAGADETKLPQTDLERFANMPAKDTVRIAGKEIPIRSYISSGILSGFEVIVPPGVYNTGNINFTGINDFTLLGYGVYLIFPNYTQMAITMIGSENLGINGLFIDHSEVANTQGKVVEKGSGYIVWQADTGYVQNLLDSSKFSTSGGISPAGEGFRNGSDIPFSDLAFSVEATAAEGKFKLLGADASKMLVGDSIVFRGKTAHVNYLVDCKDIVYQDVTLFNGSGFGFMEYGGYGNTRIDRMAITPGPKPSSANTERLISTCDATHSTNMRMGIQVTNSLFEKMTDDAANINSTYGGVLSFDNSSKELVYSAGPPNHISINADFLPGDNVLVYTMGGKLLYDGKAVSASQSAGGNKKKVTLSAAANFDAEAGKTIVVNASAGSSGFLYDNCLIQNNRSRGILVKAPDGKIINSTFRTNGMSAILVKPEISDNWGESGFSQNLLISNNLIESSGFFSGSELHSPIAVSADATPTGDSLYHNHKNITITGNTILTRYTKYAISVNGVEGLRIENNTFGGRVKSYAEFIPQTVNPIGPNDDTVPPISISGLSNAIVANNIFPASTQQKVFVSPTAQNLSGNDVEDFADNSLSVKMMPVYSSGGWKLQLSITNISAAPVSGTLELVLPEEFSSGTKVEFEDLGTGQKEVRYLSLQNADGFNVSVYVKYQLSGGGSRLISDSMSFISAVLAPAENKPSIDGNPLTTAAEWESSPTINIESALNADRLNGWAGKEDLSAKIKFSWDSEYLYLLAEVTDDIHRQPNTSAADLWNGDSLQISIDAGRGKSVAGSEGYAEIGFALGDNCSTYAHCWNNSITGAQQGLHSSLKYSVVRYEASKQTIYEAAIPWKNIGINGKAPSGDEYIGMALIINEDDGAGQEGYMRMFDGIGSGKYPELFGLLNIQESSLAAGDKDLLSSCLTEARKEKHGNYTDETWQNFYAAIQYAQKVESQSGMTQDEYTFAQGHLEKAKENLVKLNDRSLLAELLNNLSAFNAGDYTSASWAAFVQAKQRAEIVFASKDAYQLEINKAAFELQSTVSQLVKKQKYKLFYDANGGSLSLPAAEAASGSVLIITADIPTKSGFTFLGWTVNADGSGKVYKAEDTITLDRNITLYAKWEVAAASSAPPAESSSSSASSVPSSGGSQSVPSSGSAVSSPESGSQTSNSTSSISSDTQQSGNTGSSSQSENNQNKHSLAWIIIGAMLALAVLSVGIVLKRKKK